MRGSDKLICVQYTNKAGKQKSGQVARIRQSIAFPLFYDGKVTFISKSLFKATSAGLDVSKFRNKRDDKAIKSKIAEAAEKKLRKSAGE